MRQFATKVRRFLGRSTAPGNGARSDRLPVTRYDALATEEVLAHLGDLGPAELAKLGDYERAHQHRAAVLAHIDARLDNEPWPGYDTLDVTGVRAGLDGAGRDRLATVLAYERAHRNRAGVLLAAQQRPADGAA
jgi:hypothetical protein